MMDLDCMMHLRFGGRLYISVALLLTVTCLQIGVDASGQVSVKFIRYENSDGEGDNGNCCDGRWIFCEQRGCDQYFHMCLDGFYGTDSMSSCALGQKTTGVTTNQDTITFGSSIGGTRNPIVISFTEWDLGIKFKVKVWDEDNNDNDFVDFLKYRLANRPARNEQAAETLRIFMRSRTRMILDVKTYCDANWYGADCGTFCAPRNDINGHYTCNGDTGAKICILGWTGTDCKVNIDDCASQPCLNGGSCQDRLNSYTCDCQPDYYGTHCETLDDECLSSPCLNDGTCVNQIGSFLCRCTAGYTGSRCEVNVDECQSTPCLNGGECQDGVNEYHCACASGYDGVHCAIDIDNCESAPCQNGASCVDRRNHFSCVCDTGFTGALCESNIDDCASNPCVGDYSHCVDLVNEYRCSCPSGYTGRRCETELDECESDPCVNGGRCTDLVDRYSCACLPGYTGSDCEINVDECASAPCLGQSRCVDHVNGFTCDCDAGFTGVYCETNIDDCENITCSNNATCVDLADDFRCACLDGWTGRSCDLDLDECANVTCHNNGSCVDHFNGYSCLCEEGFTGVNCEVNVDDCAEVPCAHNGTCVDLVSDYQCLCAPGWRGNNCEDGHPCDDFPCLNEGTCVRQNETFTCACGTGYTGIVCEIDINECVSNPCQNDGWCSDQVGGYTCQCDIGFEGLNCEVDTDECIADKPCRNNGTCYNLIGAYQCVCPKGYYGKICEESAGSCQSTGFDCVQSCQNMVDGDFQSCKGCDVYVTCSNGLTSDSRPCPVGLLWDDKNKQCLKTSTTCRGCIDDRASEISMVGKLTIGDVDSLEELLSGMVATKLNISQQDIKVIDTLGFCQGDAKQIVTAFAFQISVNERPVDWAVIEHIFGRLADVEYQKILPLPLYVGGDCSPQFDKTAAKSTDTRSQESWVEMNWVAMVSIGIVALVVGVIIFVSVRVLTKKRRRDSVPHIMINGNPLYDATENDAAGRGRLGSRGSVALDYDNVVVMRHSSLVE